MEGARYRLTEPLVLTGSGPLWRAVDAAGRPRIVRFLSDEVLRAQSDRLEKIAAIRHDNVMRILDVMAQGGRWAVICQEVEGTTLDTLLTQPGAITPRRALAIARDLARGIQALHHAAVAHTDLSPANVIVGSKAVIIDLIDSGITPSFAAPELTADNDCGAELSFARQCQCDIWSWGKIVLAIGAHTPVTEQALSEDPHMRPSIDEIVRILDELLEAPGTVGVGAGEEAPVESVEAAVGRREDIPPCDASLRKASVAALLRCEVDRERTQHRRAPARHRRSGARGGGTITATVAIVAAAITLALMYVIHTDSVTSSSADAAPTAMDLKPICPTRSTAMHIVQDLTRRRALAVMATDKEGLAAVYTPDSPTKAEDMALIEGMQAQEIRVHNLSTSIAAVTVEECAEYVKLRATVAQDAHTRCLGEICTPVEAQQLHEIIVELAGPPWRVDTVTRR
ncbi:MAG: protein kinase [Actinomycetaceae bacterium]|nr:protein kinase [Actinomycetaceae bacterium]